MVLSPAEYDSLMKRATPTLKAFLDGTDGKFDHEIPIPPRVKAFRPRSLPDLDD